MYDFYMKFCENIVVGDDCWEWQGYRNKKGYGRARGESGDKELCHRIAYKLFVGPIPYGMNVLHHCDNPPCCRPIHLYCGTQQENVWDCFDRQRRDPIPHNRRLTDEDILTIRNSTLYDWQLASQYGVSLSAIQRVLSRKTWKNIP